MKASAVIGRELIVRGKSWKTYSLRLTPSVLALLFLGATWLAGDFGQVISDGQFLFMVCLCVSAFYGGIAAFFSSSCISHERADDTLGLLFLTPLKSYDVILGKFISVGLLHFQSILTLLPLKAMAFLLGGVTLKAFLGMNLFILCWLIYMTSAGICISSFCTNERISGILSLLFIAFVTVGISILIPLVGYWLEEIGVLNNLQEWNEYLFPFTPIVMFGILASSLGSIPGCYSPSIMITLSWFGLISLLVQSIFFFGLQVLLHHVSGGNNPQGRKRFVHI